MKTNLEEIKRITKYIATIKPKPAGEGILATFAIHPILNELPPPTGSGF